MSSENPTTGAFSEAVSDIPTCALDEDGILAQRARYARVAPGVAHVAREPEAVVIEFHDEFDREALEEALAVERECCPFFEFDFDEPKRTLRATVTERDKLPALDAMAHSVGAIERV